MIDTFLDKIEDENVREAIKHIIREGQGKPLSLSSTPTATAPLLLDDQWGTDDNDDLWVRKGNKLRKYTPDETIDVT